MYCDSSFHSVMSVNTVYNKIISCSYLTVVNIRYHTVSNISYQLSYTVNNIYDVLNIAIIIECYSYMIYKHRSISGISYDIVLNISHHTVTNIGNDSVINIRYNIVINIKYNTKINISYIYCVFIVPYSI